MSAPISIKVDMELSADARTWMAHQAGERRVKYAAMALAAWLGGVAGFVAWCLL